MADQPKESKSTAARPPAAKPAGAPSVPPAAAKKKTPTMSFLPTIPVPGAKGPGGFTPNLPGGPSKMGGIKPVRGTGGAPPGMGRHGGSKPHGSPHGGAHGHKPGFGASRGATWVPVGVTPASATAAAAKDENGAAPSADPSTTTSSASTDNTKKPKEKKFDQADIAPTAQSMAIDPLNLAHPMTLPFLDPVKANPTLKAEGFRGLSTQTLPDIKAAAAAPTSISNMGTIAERSNPANLMFQNDDGVYTGEDQIFFIQLPSAIPLGTPPVRPTPAAEQAEVLGFKGTLSSLPSGNIGKLQIYKSGKVKLRIGDVLFDVSTGMPCNFLQEVAALNTEKKKYYQLGDVSRRMVCYPDVSDLFIETPKPPSSMDLS